MREQVRKAEGEPLEADKWKRIEDRLYYISGEFNDAALFERLKNKLQEIRGRHHMPANYLFYFAVPPDLFGMVAERLAAAGLTKEDEGWRRVIVEKPFGYDLESARALNAELTKGLRESQIYRIDHYLGKETVQNILAFRFANGIFEPIWNRRYVDHVQMTVAEEVGVEHRGAYYDKAGALRDIVQNHMFQVMTLVAMEPPISFRAEDVRDEKVKVLHAVVPLTPADVKQHVVRAQYAGYTKEPNVDPASRTETFVAMRLFIDNWRWAGVPIYLRTGKKLPRRVTEVVVQFKAGADDAVPRDAGELAEPEPARPPHPARRRHLALLRGQGARTVRAARDGDDGFQLRRVFQGRAGHRLRDAALRRDGRRPDAVPPHGHGGGRMAGRPADPRRVEEGHELAGPTYDAGTWGPAEADLLIERDGRAWRD